MTLPERKRLPDTRESVTRRFQVRRAPKTATCPKCSHAWEEARDALKVYAHVGLYPNGKPGEVFLTADKVGGMAHGALDALAIAISIGLQHGVPLEAYANKFFNMRFDPQGFTGDSEYPTARSIVDLLARWFKDRFLAPKGLEKGLELEQRESVSTDEAPQELLPVDVPVAVEAKPARRRRGASND